MNQVIQSITHADLLKYIDLRNQYCDDLTDSYTFTQYLKDTQEDWDEEKLEEFQDIRDHITEEYDQILHGYEVNLIHKERGNISFTGEVWK